MNEESDMIDNTTPEALFAALKTSLCSYPGMQADDVTRKGDPMWRLDDAGNRAMHDPPARGREYDLVDLRWRFVIGSAATGLLLQLDLLRRADGTLKAGLYGRSAQFPKGDANTPHGTFKGRHDATTGDYLVDFRSKLVVHRLKSAAPEYLTAAANRPARILLGGKLDHRLIHGFLLATDIAAQARAGVTVPRRPADFHSPMTVSGG